MSQNSLSVFLPFRRSLKYISWLKIQFLSLFQWSQGDNSIPQKVALTATSFPKPNFCRTHEVEVRHNDHISGVGVNIFE